MSSVSRKQVIAGGEQVVGEGLAMRADSLLHGTAASAQQRGAGVAQPAAPLAPVFARAGGSGARVRGQSARDKEWDPIIDGGEDADPMYRRWVTDNR